MVRIANAVKMHRRFPNLFQLPPTNRRKNLESGDIVKIIADAERIWVIIDEKHETESGKITYDATVDNNMVSGVLKVGDPIKIHPYNIIDIDD